MKICVVGFGNIGSILAAQMVQKGHEVVIYSNTKLIEQLVVSCHDTDSNKTTEVILPLITNDLQTALNQAEWVFITYPSFMLKEFLEHAAPYFSENCYIGIVPGSGGGEYIVPTILNQNVQVIGFERVPFISRYNRDTQTIDYSKKPFVKVAAVPASSVKHAACQLRELLDMKVEVMAHYLNVTLAPSNAILHTARLYSLFNDYTDGVIYQKMPFFYEEWTEKASDYLIQLDRELEAIMQVLQEAGIIDIATIRRHYESDTVEAMTAKLTGIAAFKGLLSPAIKLDEGGYIPDLASRYFVEDFTYGLLIIKGFAMLTQIETPMTNEILQWAQKLLNQQWISKEGGLLDLAVATGLPQQYGLSSLATVVAFYRHQEEH